MLIDGVDVRVYNIHSDSASDGLPPTYQVYRGSEYIGHCYRNGRNWRWGTSNGETGTSPTRRQCLAVIVARKIGGAASGSV